MRYKLLVDAVFIAVGGGNTLLKHLIYQLDKAKHDVYFLLDERIEKNNLKFLKKNNFRFIPGSIFSRHKFYKKNNSSFNSIFCLSNIPPTIKLNVPVYTLLHQYSYIKLPSEVKLLNKIKWFVKSLILSIYKSNTNKWIVQSENVKYEFSKKYSIDNKKISSIPFYNSNELEKIKLVEKKKNKFSYISFSYDYKNHTRLIKAFSAAYEKCQKGELHLTVDNNNKKLIRMINLYRDKGIPVHNHGILDSKQVSKLYASSEYLIFPSTMESFGLPLIEAIYYQCKVLVSDLPFATTVCRPSLKFNPYDELSIADAIISSINSNPKKSELIIQDQTSDLIKLLLDV